MHGLAIAAALLFMTGTAAAGERVQAQPEVGVVTLKAETVGITAELNGRAAAYLVAEVRPQVNGIIQKRLFAEGSNVEAGAPLYQIDPAMYEAQLQAAQADLARANANAEAAGAKERRFRELLESKAVSQQDYDDVNAAYKQAGAEVAIAEAQVRIARINLDYTGVLSPISGRIGKSGVTQGALVTANQANALATIQQLDPIYVDVAQSTAGLLLLKRALDRGTLENTGEGHGTVRLILENGEPYAREGKILFSEVSVDQSTGSVSFRAEFPNPDWDLLPGMYVKAIVEFARKRDAIVVPQAALLRNPDGSAMVYVVGDGGVVERRAVSVLRALKDKWLLDDGLKDGERIVVEGVQRVFFVPGAPPPVVKPVEMAEQGQ